MKDCYNIFDLPAGLEKQVYFEKYKELKTRYSEDMFLPGEDGNNAARKLTELESAWSLLCGELDRQKINEEFGSGYGQIDMLIKEGKYDDAQSKLDSLMSRDAEWHYYQSVIFYKREWMAECRKHLVTAVNMEPGNEKYRQSLEKLDIKMANPQVPPEQFGNYHYAQNEEKACNNNTLANCCMAYCCADCCCSLAQCC